MNLKPYTYCRICGHKLAKQDDHGTDCWVCDSCGNREYQNPKPCIDAALFNDKNEVLLCVRAREPQKGYLNLPGGFIEVNESLEEAIERELAEELGATPEDHEPLVYVSSAVDEYLTSEHGADPILITVVTGRLHRTNFTPADDVETFVWKKITELSAEQMAGGETELEQIRQAAEKLNIL